MSRSKIIKTCKTFETAREAAIFILGFDLGTVAQNAHARIDDEETQTVLLNMTENDEADWTLQAIAFNNAHPIAAVVEPTPCKATEKRWIIQADPEHKGEHPYHDHRFITTEDCDFRDREAKGVIICAMRDLENQAEVAQAIVDDHNRSLEQQT